jgi:hypothetical protein
MADEDKIKQRAHQIGEAEGRPHGRDREHWEQAAREIAAEGKAKSKKTAAGGGKAKTAAETYRESRDSPGAAGETIPAPRRKSRSKQA